ncbi:MAG: hypothetical protein ABI267_01050 [Ginsengibacter sp.]
MKKLFLFSAFVVMTGLYSCGTERFIYSASPPNNPYFTKKGESKLTAYYSSNNSNSDTHAGELAGGWDLQGAYALSDHVALTASYFNRREEDLYGSGYQSPFDSSVVKYKRNLFGMGAGYFIPLNKRKTIYFNFYGGMDFGQFSFEDNGTDNIGQNYNRYHRSNITKWYFQPSFNFIKRNFRMSIIFKSSYVHYGNIKTSYTPLESQDFSLDILKNQTVHFFEPAWNFQFGLPRLPWIKLDLTFSGASTSEIFNESVRQNNTSVGLSFDFSKMKVKK